MSKEKFPYYIYPDILALAEATGEERTRLLRRISAGVGPTDALRTLVGADPEEFRDFYGELDRPDMTTDDTISEFLDRFGPSSPTTPASPSLSEATEEIPVAPPAIDYASQLLEAEEIPMQDDPTADLLNSFLPSTAPVAHAPAKPASKPEPEPKREPETPAAQLALVKIMIKNGNYHKALEIITDLNLKNPKKSVYFADQMRFLQKLILAQEKSGKRND